LIGELLDELVGAVLGTHEDEGEVALVTEVLDQRIEP
jgi:hypothetical protein